MELWQPETTKVRAYPKERFVYHNSGLGGNGGSSYIDAVILRQSDNLAWTAQADDTLGIRQYYCQNWRADIGALLSDTGKMVEWVKYSSYGVPTALPCGDTDSDGDWDATDSGAITGGYDVRKDAELDGDVDANDITRANAITGSYQTLGRGLQSSTAVANRKGYAGYEYDPVLEGAGRHLSHVRNRVYDADLGRWTRRDPLGYSRLLNLYHYVDDSPAVRRDPTGLFSIEVTGRYHRLSVGPQHVISQAAWDFSVTPFNDCGDEAWLIQYVTHTYVDASCSGITGCPYGDTYYEAWMIPERETQIVIPFSGSASYDESELDMELHEAQITWYHIGEIRVYCKSDFIGRDPPPWEWQLGLPNSPAPGIPIYSSHNPRLPIWSVPPRASDYRYHQGTYCNCPLTSGACDNLVGATTGNAAQTHKTPGHYGSKNDPTICHAYTQGGSPMRSDCPPAVPSGRPRR